MSTEIVDQRFREFLKSHDIQPSDAIVPLLKNAFTQGVHTGFEIADLDEDDEDPNA